MADQQAERTAVRRQSLHVVDAQSVACKNLVDDKKRKIRKMLVIDRVELPFLDQTQQMRKFKSGGPGRFQQHLEAHQEIMQVGNVGEHIVCGHQIRGLAGGGKAARGFSAEKRYLGSDALVLS